MKILSSISFFAIALLALLACEKKVEIEKYGDIHGFVLSDSSNLPLANVRISTTPASSVVLTDSTGAFTISKVLVGETSVKADKSGYKTVSASVNVTEDEVSEIYLVMEEATSTGNSNKGTFSSRTPEDEAQNIAVDTTLSWYFSESSEDITFDVFLYPATTTIKTKIVADTTDSTVAVPQLLYNTTYFWYIIAKEDGEQIAISDIWQFTTADLPDNRLVFARETATGYDIFSSGLSGNNSTQLTNSTARDWNPALSPVLNRVAFTSNRGNNYQIFHMNRDGSDLQLATSVPVTGYHNEGLGYCWSPSGSGFLFSYYDKIQLVNKDGSGLTTVMDTAPAGRNWRELDWNGLTQKIVAQTVGVNIYDSEIYIMDQDGSNAQILVPNDPGRTDHPVLSINGTKMLYTQDAQGFNSVDGRQLDARIYLMDLNTMTVTDLSVDKPAGTNDLLPEFSPNNSKVIFINEDNTGSGTKEIWEMDLTGGNRKLLITDGNMPDAL